MLLFTLPLAHDSGKHAGVRKDPAGLCLAPSWVNHISQVSPLLADAAPDLAFVPLWMKV